MKALILASMIATSPVPVGSYTQMKYTGQREGEPLIYVQSWSDLACVDTDKNIVIRMLPKEKTIAVSCE